MPVLNKLPHKHVAGGGSGVKAGKEVEKPNIVKTYQFGKTTVHIASNAFVKTEEEKKRVLHEFHMAGWAIIRELQEKKSQQPG